MGRTTIFFMVLLFGLTFKTVSQEGIDKLSWDSLQEKSYDYLAQKFYEYEEDSIKAIPYARAYLYKSKKINDSIKIANGFYFLSLISDTNLKVSFIDSILVYTQTKQNEYFPSLAYLEKANYYYKNRNFYKALQNYLFAKKSIEVNKDPELHYYIKNRIALLKSRYGEDKAALKLFKEVYDYYVEHNYFKKYKHHYFPIVFALSDSYYRNEVLDSASFYTQKGYKESQNYPVYRNYFIFEQGIIEYSKGKYSAAIDSLEKSLPTIIQEKDLPNVAYANYFIGKSYVQKNKIKKAIKHFKRVDSVYQIIKDIHPDLRDAYVHLIDYYKSKKDKNKQLLYITRLLEVDSMLHSNYKIINKKFTNEYDTPKLMAEKNRLIGQLRNNITNFSTWINILLLISIIFIVIALGLYIKRKKDIRRFNRLREDSKKQKISNIGEPVKAETDKIHPSISKELLEDILKKLFHFEREKAFLKKKLKVSDLAKQFGTNSKYLSMVINEYKHKNFSQYLNDLRIEYVVKRLQDDVKFRKYTIKAISEEVGFSNSESFSKAFHIRTKIYPSFFINQLDKLEKKKAPSKNQSKFRNLDM